MGISVVAVIILCIWKYFHSEIVKLKIEGNFREGIKLHVIYVSITDTNMKTMIILLEIQLPSIRTLKSWSDEPLWCL